MKTQELQQPQKSKRWFTAAGKDYNEKVKKERKLNHSIRLVGIKYNPIFKKKAFKCRFLSRLYDPPRKKIKVRREK